MEVSEFSDELQKKILQFLPECSPRVKPVDLGGYSISVDIIAKKLPVLVIENGEVEGLLFTGLTVQDF